MDGIPPERVVTDSWPALHGRPVLRRTVAVGLVLCVSVAAALVVRGVNSLTAGRVGRETDRDRAELLAGLHPSQHPGVGRSYVPVGAIYTHTPDGAPIAYLHYRVAGKDVGLGDFLRAYDLPAPGPAAPLPADLTAALGGDGPAEAPELLPDPEPTSTTAASPTPSLTPTADPAPPAPSGLQAADPDAEPDPDAEAGPAPDLDDDTPEPAPSVTLPPTPTPTPTPTPIPPSLTPTPAPPRTHPQTTRRIYVATIPGAAPGAADIYIRATG
ncbi:hypothetical protein ACFVTF_32505 [Kitasatospora sp. NPDC057940]|uniref:hypothetical protein n=1 Tax=Kitasatospora sp. NPDC057940 TaxID=3346285 RepID=UPI0036DE8A6C